MVRECLTAFIPFAKIKVSMKKSRGHFNVVLRPDPEGGFTAIVPVLPGCVTYGRTLAEARKMAKDAISAYIESLKKHGAPIPKRRAIVPQHSRDIPKGALVSLLKEAGFSREELIDFLQGG
jgi:antitoxin HicB